MYEVVFNKIQTLAETWEALLNAGFFIRERSVVLNLLIMIAFRDLNVSYTLLHLPEGFYLL